MRKLSYKMRRLSYLFGDYMIRTILVFLITNFVMVANIMAFKSTIIGTLASAILIYISSTLCGNIFWKDIASWRKTAFGFSTFITFLALGGSAALIFYQLSSGIVAFLLLLMSTLLIVVNMRGHRLRGRRYKRKRSSINVPATNDKNRAGISRFFSTQHVALTLYTVLAGVCLFFLLISRSEEVSIVWNAIHPAFLPLFFALTLVLLIVIYSNTSEGIKISLIFIHSILIHSVLIIALNPGFYGDQWIEIGRVRDIVKYGNNEPNVLNIVTGKSPYSTYLSAYYLIRKRAYQALVAILANMFNIDLYWSHLFLTPILWGVIVPFITYENAKILGGKEKAPVLSAFFSLSVPLLIWWGALSLPDTLSIVFFYLATHLVLRYLSSKNVRSSLLFLVFAAILVSFLSHFKTGVVVFSILLLAFALKDYEGKKRKFPTAAILLIFSLIVCSSLLPLSLFALYAVYPLRGYMHPYFSLEKLAGTDIWALIFGPYVTYPPGEFLLSLLVPLLGIAGLIYVIIYASHREYKRSLCFFLLLVEMIFFIDYRVLKYAMINVPFSPERLWVFRDLLLLPLAGMMVGFLIAKMRSATPIGLRSRGWLGKRHPPFNVAIVIFCLLFSVIVAEAVHSAYITKPIMSPTPYDIEAIEYIHRNTPGNYIVIGDPVFVSVASEVLGRKTAVEHYTREFFYDMYPNPSREVLVEATQETGSIAGYFVISNRYSKFSEAVASGMEVIDVYKVFGDGKLYVFRYPEVELERVIPIQVDAGNYSRVNYPVEYEVFWNQTLFGVAGVHLDANSISVIDLSSGREVPSKHENFQAWFDDCSSSGNWSGGISDGDLLTYTVHMDETQFDKGQLRYLKFKFDGGDLEIDPKEYNYIEIKWKENYDDVANLRFAFWQRIGDKNQSYTKWASASTEWSVWRYDYSSLNETLYGLWIDIFEANPEWVGDYELSIDWIRFVSDSGTVRWLYNGTANTEAKYQIEYDFLENTASGNKDGLPVKVGFNETSPEDGTIPPPQVREWLSVALPVRTVDLLNQPISGAEIEVKDVEVKVITDINGWAYVSVPLGQWTIVASKRGATNQRMVEALRHLVITQRLNLVQLDGWVLTVWEFVLVIGLIAAGCILVILFLNRKILLR